MAIDSLTRESQAILRDAHPGPEVLIKEAKRQARRRLAVVGSTVVAVVALAAAAALALTSSPAGRSSTTRTVPPSSLAGAPICGDLSATTLQAASPASEEDSFVVELSNSGSHLCQLNGYPTVRLFSAAGHALSFSVQHSPPGPWDITTAAPRPVRMSAGGLAYFQFATSPANCPGWTQATRIAISLPNTSQRLDLKIPPEPFIAGCSGGSVASVTPIETSQADLLGRL